MNDEGIGRAALLLRSLGEEEAAEVLKHLSAKEVQKLGEAMSKIDKVSRENIESVLERFHAEAAQQIPLGGDSPEYIRGVLIRALGDDKAKYVLERIVQGSDTSGIESLKWMDPAAVAELIRSEHPQIIASILVHLEHEHSAAILGHLAERLRNDIVFRIATMDGIQPSALKELNDTLAKILSGSESIKRSPLGGVRAAAGILNFLGSTQETAVLESVRESDAELAQKILDEMFVFDNLLDLEDRAIQMVLREVQSESLVVALKGANEQIREKIFANMSQRAAEMLRDDLEAKGPVRISEVEAEQREILKIVRRLAEEGQIALGAKADDAYV